MKISDVMSENVICVQVSDTMRAVAKMMKDSDIGALPVLDNGTPVGFVTDRDIVLAIAEDDCELSAPISEAMSPEVFAISPDKEITEAARIMEDKQVSRILVVENNKPVGMVTLQDLTLNVDNTHLKAEVIEQIKH